jgi:hypothetical protein
MDLHLPDWRERRRRLDTGSAPIQVVSEHRSTLGSSEVEGHLDR